MRKIGIYKLVNLQSSKAYIGSTTDSLERNWSHLSKLNRNVHYNKELQADFNRIGAQNFEFIMIEECSVDMLHEREQYWSDEIKSKYNIRKDVKSNLGVFLSEENKKKMSINRLGSNNPFYGKKHSEESNKKRSELRGAKSKRSKIVIDTLTGIFYDSAREAADAKGIKNSLMISMLNGSRKNKTNLKYA